MTRTIFVLVFLALAACGDTDFVNCVEGMDDLDLNIESCTRAMEKRGSSLLSSQAAAAGSIARRGR